MPTVQASGTQTASIGVEQTLADLISPFAVYQSYVDRTNMQQGDVMELRIYTKILPSSGLHEVFYTQFGMPTNDSDNPVVESLPLASDQEVKFTLKQINGTARTYDWKVISIP